MKRELEDLQFLLEVANSTKDSILRKYVEMLCAELSTKYNGISITHRDKFSKDYTTSTVYGINVGRISTNTIFLFCNSDFSRYAVEVKLIVED